MEPIGIGAALAVALGLVEVLKKLIEKFAPQKESSTDKDIAGALVSLSQSQERVAETLSRIEAKLSFVSDNVIETKLRVVTSKG